MRRTDCDCGGLTYGAKLRVLKSYLVFIYPENLEKRVKKGYNKKDSKKQSKFYLNNQNSIFMNQATARGRVQPPKINGNEILKKTCHFLRVFFHNENP